MHRQEAQAWQRGRDAHKLREESKAYTGLSDAGVGEGKTSRHYPRAFSRHGGDGLDDTLPPDEDLGDGSRDAGSGYRRQPSPIPRLLPKEIYEKLSEYVIGQVRTRHKTCCMGWVALTRAAAI